MKKKSISSSISSNDGSNDDGRMWTSQTQRA